MVLHGDDAEVCIASFFSLLGFLFSFILDVTMQVPHVKGSIWIYACQKLIRWQGGQKRPNSCLMCFACLLSRYVSWHPHAHTYLRINSYIYIYTCTNVRVCKMCVYVTSVYWSNSSCLYTWKTCIHLGIYIYSMRLFIDLFTYRHACVLKYSYHYLDIWQTLLQRLFQQSRLSIFGSNLPTRADGRPHRKSRFMYSVAYHPLWIEHEIKYGCISANAAAVSTWFDSLVLVQISNVLY